MSFVIAIILQTLYYALQSTEQNNNLYFLPQIAQ